MVSIGSWSGAFCGGSSGHPYLLLQTGGAAAAGLFAAASQFAGVITLLTGGLATAWLPYFQSHADQQIKWTRTYRLLLHSHLIGSALICIVVMAIADDALRWLASPAYASAGTAITRSVVANLLDPCGRFLSARYLLLWSHRNSLADNLAGAIATGIVLAAYGSDMDAAAAARALALGSAALVLTQLLVNRTRQYPVHSFGQGWVIVATLGMCASLFVGPGGSCLRSFCWTPFSG